MSGRTAYLGLVGQVKYILHVWGIEKNEWLIVAKYVDDTQREYHPGDLRKLPNDIRSRVKTEKERCIQNMKAG